MEEVDQDVAVKRVSDRGDCGELTVDAQNTSTPKCDGVLFHNAERHFNVCAQPSYIKVKNVRHDTLSIVVWIV